MTFKMYLYYLVDQCDAKIMTLHSGLWRFSAVFIWNAFIFLIASCHMWSRVQERPKKRHNKQTTYWQHTHTHTYSIFGLKLWSAKFLLACFLSLIPLSLYLSLSNLLQLKLKHIQRTLLWHFCGLLCVAFSFFFCCFFFVFESC